MPVSIKGPVLALSFSAGVVVLGFGLIAPFMPMYAENLGATVGIQVGIMTSSFLLTRTSLAPFAGSASDRYGRKRMIILGLIVYSIVSLLFGLSQDWYELLFFRALQGVGSAMVWPPATAMIGDLTPPGQRSYAMGLYDSISMGGYIIGPALGGGIVWYATNFLSMSSMDSYRMTFYFSSAISLLAVFLVYFLVKVPPGYTPTKRSVLKISLKGVDARAKRTIYAVFLFVFAYGFASSFIDPILVWFIQHQYSLSEVEVATSTGVIFSISSVLAIAVTLYAGRISDRFSKKKIIAVPTLMAQFLTIIMPFSRNVTEIGFVMSARSASYSFTSPAYSALQQDLLPQNLRGALTGLFDTFFGIGSFIGPLISFAIYDSLSPMLPFAVSGVLGIATVIILLLFVNEPTKEELEAINQK